MNVQDWKLSFRTLVKERGFSIPAIITLAFGIGANALVFSILNTALFHPLPYPNPGRLIQIIHIDQHTKEPSINLSIPDVREIRTQAHGLESIGYYRYAAPYLTLRTGAAVHILAAQVSPAFFNVLGINPFLRRQWPVDDELLGDQQALVLSYSFWKTHLDSNPSAVGRMLALDGKPSLVIGVMPRMFKYPDPNLDAWVMNPTESESANSRSIADSFAVARLQPGVQLSRLQKQLDTIAGRLEGTYPEDKGLGFRAVSLQAETVGPVKATLLILFGAVGLVLLAACTNVSALLLARSSRRRREIATRMALGASRYRIIRQLLRENLLLSLAGGALGLGMAIVGVPIVRWLAPSDIPRIGELAVNIEVLGFALSVSLLAVVLFGLMPAIQISNINLSQALSAGGDLPRIGLGHFRSHRVQSVLTIFQVAVALIILISAGLLVKNLSELMAVHLGFDPHNMLVVSLDESRLLPEGLEGRNVFYNELLNQVGSIPGVQSAALTYEPPLTHAGLLTSFSMININARPEVKSRGRRTITKNQGEGHQVGLQVVTRKYFNVMGTVVIRGREFTQRDTSTSLKVVIINQAAGHLFWPTGNPVGAYVNVDGSSHEIVGLVENVREGLENYPAPEFYLLFDQANTAGNGYSLVVRTDHNPAELNHAIASKVSSMQYENVPSTMTMDDMISRSLIAPRFHAGLMGLFAVLTLVLAWSGLYGTLAYSVSLRTREIGILMALGAQQHHIFRSVLVQGLTMVLLGCGAGLAGSLLLARIMASLLYGITPFDPATWIIATSLLILAALVACYVPAVRATRVDIMAALRHE